MTGRLMLLGVMLASLPLAVDVPAPRDTTRAGQLQVELAGGGGQFAVISRGCNGEVLRVTHNQLRSGALVVEERMHDNFVLGVRAGKVVTTWHATVGTLLPPFYQYRESTYTQRISNPYVNPYVGYDGPMAGLGVGALIADRPFLFGKDVMQHANLTAHATLGPPSHRLTVRWMEDVPLESEGHFSVDLGLRPSPNFDAGMFAGFMGPYDGAMLGVRGRLWLTPDAAAQIKASITGINAEYGVYGSVTARLPHGR